MKRIRPKLSKAAQKIYDEISARINKSAREDRKHSRVVIATLAPEKIDAILHALHAGGAPAALGALGYHPSLLPRHRGRSAIEWAVRFGDPVTGGSVYWLNDVVDGGPVAAQDWCHILPGDTAAVLWKRDLAPMGLRLFAKVFDALDRGIQPATEQDTASATWEPAVDKVPPLWRPDAIMIGPSTHTRGEAVR